MHAHLEQSHARFLAAWASFADEAPEPIELPAQVGGAAEAQH